LSELVEELFGRLGYPVPQETTVLPVPEDKLSVADLVDFLAAWERH
jgi:hypothetical protein